MKDRKSFIILFLSIIVIVLSIVHIVESPTRKWSETLKQSVRLNEEMRAECEVVISDLENEYRMCERERIDLEAENMFLKAKFGILKIHK